MKPANVMGTFLRVWRSEWAQLSRAQLASAIQRQLARGKRVTVGVVRWWEAGQPPGSTEELQALLAVMRSHGLTGTEVDQFRQITFAACLDRHYPGLVDHPDLIQGPDVVGLAMALVEQAGSLDSQPTLAATALLAALEPAVAARRHPAAPGTLEHSQDVAYALSQHTLATCHGSAGRRELACSAYGHNINFLKHRLGGAAPCGVNATASRLSWLYHASFIPESGDVSPRLLDAYTAATERGDTAAALMALGWLLDIAGRPAFRHLRAELRPLHPRFVELGAQAAGGEWAAAPHYQLATLALKDGNLGEAEQHLSHIGSWEHHEGWLGLCWHYAAGNHARARGDWQEAIGYLGRAAELARATGNVIQGSAEETLRACERALNRRR